jgi:transcriptional regulator with XRE-family HTH domain
MTNLLTAARESAGLTIPQLAKRLHAPRTLVKSWEDGTRYCGISDICKIAAALNIQPDALLPKAKTAAAAPKKSVRQTIMDDVAACGDRVSLLRLAVYRAEDALHLAENADTFTTESNRAIREAEARLQAARDALYAATRRPPVEALPEREFV